MPYLHAGQQEDLPADRTVDLVEESEYPGVEEVEESVAASAIPTKRSIRA